jgi:endonuclease/exonuclease/phosphatase family metal-dependent hydrolase
MIATIRRACVLGVLSCVLSAAFVTAADAATAPPPATGLVAKTSWSTAVLTWKPAAGATSYRVCLQEYYQQSPCVRLSGTTSKTTATFASLAPTSGTDYYFVVYGYRDGARSASAPKGFNLATPPAPSAPTVTGRSVGFSTLTVTWARASYARQYSVCLMTDGPNDSTCLRSSPRSAARTASFTGLTPTGGTDYFFRVRAFNETGSSRSTSHTVDLRVGPIESITATKATDSARVSNVWAPAINAGTYQLQFATNSTMTSGLKTWTLSGTSATLTKLTIGTTYYYRVRGVNGAVSGPYTATKRIRVPSEPTRVVVLTYNLCGQDKCVNSSNGMKKWTTRKAYAGKMVRATASDIIATQESHNTDTRFGTELPGFGLAAYYSAKSLFYNTSKYDKLRSGVITLNSEERKYAVWAEFRDKITRTVFIVVDAHLQPYKGKTRDDMRAAQTTVLLRKTAVINPSKYPVVYAGDFNSNKSNADQTRYPGGYDAPLQVFTAAGIVDTFDTATTFVNRTWNSSNQAVNPPIKHSDHIDHIFVDPNITASQWKVVISLNGTNYATPFASDHNPIRAILTVPGR